MTDDQDGSSVLPGFRSMSGRTADVVAAVTALRVAKGLSQTEVAARMGTSQSALARLESGRYDVRLSTLARYAAAVDAEIDFAVRHRHEE